MVKAVDLWRQSQLTDVEAKLLIYQAFIEAELEVPRHLDRTVHNLYFNPQQEEFHPRTMWSISNAFTSAFKELEPIPQFKATGKLAGFLRSIALDPASLNAPNTYLQWIYGAPSFQLQAGDVITGTILFSNGSLSIRNAAGLNITRFEPFSVPNSSTAFSATVQVLGLTGVLGLDNPFQTGMYYGGSVVGGHDR